MYKEGDPATVLAKNTGFSENAYHLEARSCVFMRMVNAYCETDCVP